VCSCTRAERGCQPVATPTARWQVWMEGAHVCSARYLSSREPTPSMRLGEYYQRLLTGRIPSQLPQVDGLRDASSTVTVQQGEFQPFIE
jgi:hypothetical protein